MRQMPWILVIILVALSANAFYYSFMLQNEVEILQEEVENLRSQLQQIPRDMPAEETPIVPNTEILNFTIRKEIPIVAVSGDGRGILSSLSMEMAPGNDQVLVATQPFLEPDLQHSLNEAVDYAKRITGYSNGMDFIYNYKINTTLIGGGSAGASAAIVTIAGIENKTLKEDAVITGTINYDGSIGVVGGIQEKAQAVADAGYSYFLVPEGQATQTTYEREIVTREPFPGFILRSSRYVAKTVNLADVAHTQWGLTIVEVGTLEEALPYFID
jgi:predicted S18 family serine protease